jgi:signal transduction histidine kinase
LRRLAGRPASGWLLAGGCALAFVALLAWLGRPSADGTGAEPWALVSALAAAFALGTVAGAWHASGNRRRGSHSLGALVAAGQRLLDREGGPRIAPPPQPEFAGLVALLNRVADLRGATEAVLADRDAQLASLHALTGWYYWEQDPSGRYTRIDAAGQGDAALVESLLGRTRWDGGGVWMGAGVASAASTSLRDPQWTSVRDAMTRGEPLEEIVWMQPLSGTRRLFLLETAVPRFGPRGEFTGWLGALREIGAELARERAAATVVAALQVATQPVLQIEAAAAAPGWRIRWGNTAACALVGRSAAELAATDPARMVSQPDELGAALAAGTGLRRAGRVADRYGQWHEVLFRLDPMPAVDGLAPLATLSLDPAAARPGPAAQEAAAAEIEKLRAQVQALEAASDELRAFGSAVSHDLRAPLRVIDGFARLLREDFGHSLDRVAHDHVERIVSAAARMNRMIDALLRLARVSSEPIGCEPVDLSAIAARVVAELRAQHPERLVEAAIEPGLSANGDPVLLRVLLENLLGNAWKYTGKRADARVAFGRRDVGGTVAFCVDDNGAGFDMRFADRLFRMFNRLHSAGDFPGTGVGLATVERIVRRHGGRVWADSAPGDGARFYFTIGTGESGSATG